jgi:hypothetical protein
VSRTNQTRPSGRSGEVQDFTSSNHPPALTNIDPHFTASHQFLTVFLPDCRKENNVTSSTWVDLTLIEQGLSQICPPTAPTSGCAFCLLN